MDVGVSSDMIVKTSVFGKNKEVNVNDFYATWAIYQLYHGEKRLE